MNMLFYCVARNFIIINRFGICFLGAFMVHIPLCESCLKNLFLIFKGFYYFYSNSKRHPWKICAFLLLKYLHVLCLGCKKHRYRFWQQKLLYRKAENYYFRIHMEAHIVKHCDSQKLFEKVYSLINISWIILFFCETCWIRYCRTIVPKNISIRPITRFLQFLTKRMWMKHMFILEIYSSPLDIAT